MKLLWASPLPPVRSGVSDYAVELLGELERVAEVRVVRPPGWEPPPGWSLEARMVEEDEGPRPDELQLVHMGNNPHHEWLLPRLAQPRTVVVLHDAVVHHLLVEATVARGREGRYGDMMAAAYGERGAVLAGARRLGITGRRDPFLFPARTAVLGEVVGAVVHSRWAARELARDVPTLPVVRVPLAAADPGPVDRTALRTELGVAPDALLVMHLGFLTLEKGMLHILGALAAARRRGEDVRLVLVGEGREEAAIDAAVSALGLGDQVTRTGWVEAEQLLRLPAAADLGVVMRTPSAGETSAAALRFLACGTPVAVTALHQFLEWPEAAAPRITPGPAATADLARLLAAAGRTGWGERRAAARQAYLDGHRPADVARGLVEALVRLSP
jgi:glycosyltransferase involved in cell wall biosynthesis